MSDRLNRVKSWEKFKRLVVELKPKSLVYIIEQNGLTQKREMTVLRLILPAPNVYHVYLDFPRGNKLRETSIPIHDDKGNRHLEDDDIKKLLKKSKKVVIDEGKNTGFDKGKTACVYDGEEEIVCAEIYKARKKKSYIKRKKRKIFKKIRKGRYKSKKRKSSWILRRE